MNSRRAQIYIYAQEHKLYQLLLLSLWKALRNKTEKGKKTSTKTKMASWFSLADYIV